jgi:3-isopropylmalate dehydratase small subunit
MTSKGRIWKFGDDINTDLIIPGRFLENYDPAHLAAHAMEGAREDFAKKVSKGDILVVGRNFGCGSSREQAVMALKEAGISAIIARSFARIFYRNSINLGLPVFLSDDASMLFADGENASLEIDELLLVSEDRKKRVALEPMPNHLKEILDLGGLVPFVKRQLEQSKT